MQDEGCVVDGEVEGEEGGEGGGEGLVPVKFGGC